MRETDPQIGWQPVERATHNQRNQSELRLRRHGHGPRHHVFGHAWRSQHVPRVHQHCRAFRRTMAQKSQNSRIVQIFIANVIADLHSNMPGAHAAAQFRARCVDILQRNLTKSFQPSFPLSA